MFEHAVDLPGGLARYRFFTRPLPEKVLELRRELYFRCARIGNAWDRMLGREERFPATLEAFLAYCKLRGQSRTTPILIRYDEGAANEFHRDLHGDVSFPIQLAVTLGPRSAAAGDGAEFLVGDVRPGKRKSKVVELAPGIGDGVLFCTRDRLVRVGGVYGLQPVRHGTRPLLAGRRYTLGVPFHDFKG